MRTPTLWSNMGGKPRPDDETIPDGSGSHFEESDAPPAALDVDFLYEALRDSRRRYLCYLLGTEPEWSVDDLARRVASWEEGVPEGEVDDRKRRRVALSLRHAHLPKLTREDVVSFDERAGTVSPGANAETVFAALDALVDELDAG